ncbi:MAG TPA: Co2+/Mg2+ efflux protein ApaG [Polyangiaceae bacterium]|nr:Co2+/Mg2+ efflux protein ApaG [Polyangiaceae bacterium]
MDRESRGHSAAVTDGVRVTVEARYSAEQSLPAARRYVFAYTVRIRNEGREGVQLRSRHWILTDSAGHTEEVRGEGVIGEQPVLPPGGQFEYMSAAVLKTPRGEMRGSYQMVTWNGRSFDATIAPFQLALPYSLN